MAGKGIPAGKGLALSGGGYRASLFHVGALWRLNELGWLRKLDEITSVSGGSIVAAYLGLRWSELDFDSDDVARNFGDVFVQPMRKMCGTTIDFPTIATGLLNPIGSASGRVNGKRLTGSVVGILGKAGEVLGGRVGRRFATSLTQPFADALGAGINVSAAAWDALNPFPTPSEQLIKAYDRLLFDGKTLKDLPNPDEEGNPYFTLYASNMQTGVSVRMSREYISDYKLGRVKNPDLPLAKAVAASSGFPPFYCPVELEVPLERWSGVKGSELAHRDDLRKRIDLGDGAVYDNLGLTRLEAQWHKIGTILVSDAGGALEILDGLPFEWLSQAMRTLIVSMDQTNKLRVRQLNGDFYDRKKNGTYWSIADKITKDESWGRKGETQENKKTLTELGKGPELLDDNEQTLRLGSMRTRLNHFTDAEQESLINWGYALADARMRRWVLEDDPAGTLPFPGRLQ